jgi:purine-nucleoside phosphorylase
MSTAHEARVAAEVGMECLAISGITNRAAGLGANPINHEEVLQSAFALSQRMATLVGRFLAVLN